MPKLLLPSLALLSAVVAGGAQADVSSGTLSNKFTGAAKCLAPARGDQVAMVTCDPGPEQVWDLTPLDDKRRDRFRIENRATTQCLDIVNDGTNNKLTLAACGNYTGQFWTQRWDHDGFRLTTDFTGARKCLDVVNDGRNDKLIMAPCGNYSGQLWDVTGNH